MTDTAVEGIKRMADDPEFFIEHFLKTNLSNKQRDFLKATTRHKHIINWWSRQTGKSTIMARWMMWKLLYGKGKVVNGEAIKERIYVFAPIEEQCTNIFLKVRELVDKFPFIEAYIDKMNSDIIEAKNGNVIRFMSASPGSHIRGATATVIIIDESQDVTDEKYHTDIMPMGATTDPIIIESFTPKSKNHSWRTVNNPAVKVIKQMWFECPFLSKEFVESEKKKMPEAQFMQEYMCVFVEEGVMAFPSKLLTAPKTIADYEFIKDQDRFTRGMADAQDRFQREEAKAKGEPEPKRREFAMGIDVGRQNDPTEITVLDITARPIRCVAQIQYPLGASFTQIQEWIKEAFDAYAPAEINIDYTNEKNFVEDLQKIGVPVRIDPENKAGAIAFTNANKTEMINKAQLALEKGQLQLPANHERLIMQFLNQQYEYSADTKKYKYYHPSNEHDDALWSLLLALKNVPVEGMDHAASVGSADPWTRYNENIHGGEKRATSEVLGAVCNYGRRVEQMEGRHEVRTKELSRDRYFSWNR